MTAIRTDEKSTRRPMGPDSMITFHGLKTTLKILSASAPDQADLRQLCADAVLICDELQIGIDIAYRQRLIQARPGGSAEQLMVHFQSSSAPSQ